MIKRLLYSTFLALSIASIIHMPILNVARIYLAIWFIFSLLFFFTNRKLSFNFINIEWLIFPLFLLLHTFSLLYTNNLTRGFFDIEVKLSFIVIPFLFFLVYQHFYEKLPITKMKRLYLVSLFIIVIFLTIRAIVSYISDNNISHLYYNELSWKYHPSYLAMYISLGIIILIEKLFENDNKVSYIYVIGVTVLLVFLFLLSSKAGIIVTFVLLIVASLYQILFNKVIIKSVVLSIIAIIFAYYGIHENYRFQAVKSSIEKVETNIQTSESNAIRILIWETGIDLLKTHWLFGVGCGDIKDVLINEYEKRNMHGAVEKKLNLHNQYIETWLSLGIFGLLMLLTILFLPFVIAFKQKNVSWLLFIMLIAGNFITESMLNTQAGVIFITYFYYFFYVEHKLKIHDTIFTAKN